MEGLKSLYDALQEEFKGCEALAIWRTRTQMMYSYLIGETSIWPAQKEVDDYLANGATMEELAVPVVDVGDIDDTANTEVIEAQSVEDAPVSLTTQEEEGAPIIAPQDENEEEGEAAVAAPIAADVHPEHMYEDPVPPQE
ncbi:hypothetical protein SOVF_172850 [Spinacia oleracea]|nr:hypothetical protein SOVF_172850 [Spinacia oleracea]